MSKKLERMSSEGKMSSPSEVSQSPASSMLSRRFRSDCKEREEKMYTTKDYSFDNGHTQ